ncbi:MAG: OB-fold nucleic acid binding domain-containing protein [Candidatus Woesearchaeota archaeon]
MMIKDLQARMGKVELVATVIDKGQIREFNKEGKSGRVCNAKIKDETGEVSLTLWNDDCDKVNLGDKVQIKNGFVSEWQGELQLSTGKFGSLEVVEKTKTLSEVVDKKEDEFDE